MKEMLARLSNEELKYVYEEYLSWCQTATLPDDSVLRIVMIQSKMKDADATIPMIVTPMLAELIRRHLIAFDEIYNIYLEDPDADVAVARKMFRIANAWR